MKGFQEFLLRGNLIELAVAVIIGTSFAAVVEAFTGMILDLVGLIGDVPDFSSTSIGGIGVGPFLTALVAFILTAAVVYFGVVLPYTRFSNVRKTEEPEVAASTEDLLGEIRDILKAQGGPQH